MVCCRVAAAAAAVAAVAAADVAPDPISADGHFRERSDMATWPGESLSASLYRGAPDILEPSARRKDRDWMWILSLPEDCNALADPGK